MELKEFEELIIGYLKEKLPDINIAWSKNFNNLPPDPYFVQIESFVEQDKFLIWLIKYSSNITPEEEQNIQKMFMLIRDYECITSVQGNIPKKAEVYFRGENNVDYHFLDSHIIQCPIIVKLR